MKMPLRRRAVFFVTWPWLLAVGYVSPQSVSLSDLHREFGALLAPGFTVTYQSTADPANVRAVLALLRDARTGPAAFDALSRLEFLSTTRVVALFTWSGGMHGGQLEIEKTSTGWRIGRVDHLL
jgi:hypothetical protein